MSLIFGISASKHAKRLIEITFFECHNSPAIQRANTYFFFALVVNRFAQGPTGHELIGNIKILGTK